MEAVVLKRLQGVHQVCTLLDCGKTEDFNFIVMSLLGTNLSELRKKQSNHKFSISTVLILGMQIFKVVQDMHNCGFLHRDIKPSNFAMGIGTDSDTCYLLDFGLARQYITPTGELKQPRTIAGFRGTVRYASLNAHLGHELGRHDDLWSVFYMLVELGTGQLPWRQLQEKEKVAEAKKVCDHRKLIAPFPREFQLFLTHLQELTYYDKPDYQYLINLFEKAHKQLGINQFQLFELNQEVTNPVVKSTCRLSSPKLSLVPPPNVSISNHKTLSKSNPLSEWDHITHQTSHKNGVFNNCLIYNHESKEVNFSTSKWSKRHNQNCCASDGIDQAKKQSQIHRVETSSSEVKDTTVNFNGNVLSSLQSDSVIIKQSKQNSVDKKNGYSSLDSISQTYIVPLPSEPKPPHHFCAPSRLRRYVKSRTGRLNIVIVRSQK